MCPGYDHDFSGLDHLCPYELVEIKKANQRQILRLRMKDTDNSIRGDIIYNFPAHGECAFAPFIWDKKWFAFLPVTFAISEIIDLQTGETVARTKENTTSWCPVNYHVPCFYKDPEGHVHPDYEITKWLKEGVIKNEDVINLIHLNIGFVAGVFRDNSNWGVWKFDIPTIMQTGIIPIPRKDTYCFEFDYTAEPELRQYLKMRSPNPEAGAEHNKFEYYAQKFTPNGFSVLAPPIPLSPKITLQPKKRWWQRS